MQRVPGGQPRVALGAFAIQLDALEPDVFLCQRSGEQGNGLCQPPVEPLPGVVLRDGEFLHSGLHTKQIVCFYFITRRPFCKESGVREKERKIYEKVFDFPAIIRYNIHRTIMDWRALCCWI